MKVELAVCQLVFKPSAHFDAFAEDVYGAMKDVPETADYVLFPELCTLGLLTSYVDFDELGLEDYARIVDFLPAYKQLFSELAQRRNQIIIAGSTLESVGGVLYNTAYVFGPNGEELSHRKSHIFPAEALWRTEEGDALHVFDLGPVKFGIAICYEIEIPEIATMYAQQGADIIFVPSYTFTPQGFWRVRHCAHARAIENQLYVVHCPTASPAIGIINPGFGEAAILSPCDLAWTENGVVVESVQHEVISAVISLDDLYENRKSGAATTVKDRQRRKALYHSTIQ
ncbi:MAG: nitrilase-related carbon-nitrogen hydrolase [Solibacillus sp.]